MKPIKTGLLPVHWLLIFSLGVITRLIVRRHDPLHLGDLALFTTALVLSLYAGRWWRSRSTPTPQTHPQP